MRAELTPKPALAVIESKPHMRPTFVFVPRLRTLAMLFGLAGLTACSQSPTPAPTSTPEASTPSNCTVQLTGNLSSSLTLPSCGGLSLSPSEAGSGDVALDFHFTTQGLPSLDISIALGPSPSAGSYSSETSGEWSAVGLAGSQCRYSAGSESVPRGSFKLTLSTIEIADAGTDAGLRGGTESGADASIEAADAGAEVDAGTDAGPSVDASTEADADTDAGADADIDPIAGVVHGTLELTMYVQAPPATDCGIGDLENIVVDF